MKPTHAAAPATAQQSPECLSALTAEPPGSHRAPRRAASGHQPPAHLVL
jgi:hypothetical protein